MRRRPEAYHATLRRHEAEATGRGGGDGSGAPPARIHDRVLTKEAGLADRLRYDDHERRSGLVRFLPLDATAADWADVTVADLGDFLDHPFEIPSRARPGPGRRLIRDGPVGAAGDEPPGRPRGSHDHARRRPPLSDPRPGDDDHEPVGRADPRAARFRVDDDDAGWRRQPGGLVGGGRRPDRPRRRRRGAPAIETIAQGNDYIGVSVRTTVSPPADAWWAPVETISNSEGGFERVYQGSGLLLAGSWTWRPARAPRSRSTTP